MIKVIDGRVSEIFSSSEIVMEINGIGYGVSIPHRSLPGINESIRLYTYHLVREQEQALFGFKTKEELETFNHLLTVNSIGPKLAMAIMSEALPADIQKAVDENNIGFFQALSGVGKKSAAKIIVELKGKLSAGEVVVPTGGSDLADALVGLGFSAREIQPIISRLPADLENTESQVAWALKEFSS